MSHQAHFTTEQVLQQLFSQQQSSEPEEDAEEQDRKVEWEEDRGDDEDDHDDNEDYDPVCDDSPFGLTLLLKCFLLTLYPK